MVVKLSPQNISLYQNRWKLIHDFELAEANHRSLYDKLLQLSHLREAAQILGWDKKLKAENEKVRELWISLKTKFLCQQNKR